MDLSIIIVNWNSVDYLEKCLSTLIPTIKGIEYEIIVIDGASFDGCDEMLRRLFPEVKFVQSSKNLGFGRSNNEAYTGSCGDNILFLNPDTEIKTDAIRLMLSALVSLDGAGIVGAKLLNSDGSIQTSCIQSFPTILNQTLDSKFLQQCMPKSKLWGKASLFDVDRTPSEVAVVSGACLMIKKHVFEDIDMFSNDYFMYSDDVDLCFNTRKSGYKIYYVPEAVVVHHGGTSSSQSSTNSFSSIMMLESRFRYFRKNKSLQYAIRFRLAIFISSIIRLSILILVWLPAKFAGNIMRVNSALFKWKANLLWTLGLTSWVKNY